MGGSAWQRFKAWLHDLLWPAPPMPALTGHDLRALAETTGIMQFTNPTELEVHRKLKSATRADENIDLGLGGELSAQGGLGSSCNPTVRTEQFTPEERAKLEAALDAFARALGKRYRLLQFQLEFRVFLLKAKYAALMLIADLKRYLR